MKVDYGNGWSSEPDKGKNLGEKLVSENTSNEENLGEKYLKEKDGKPEEKKVTFEEITGSNGPAGQPEKVVLPKEDSDTRNGAFWKEKLPALSKLTSLQKKIAAGIAAFVLVGTLGFGVATVSAEPQNAQGSSSESSWSSLKEIGDPNAKLSSSSSQPKSSSSVSTSSNSASSTSSSSTSAKQPSASTSNSQTIKLSGSPLELRNVKFVKHEESSVWIEIVGDLYNTSSSQRFSTVGATFAIYDANGTELDSERIIWTGVAPGNTQPFRSTFSLNSQKLAKATSFKVVGYSAQ